MMRKALIPLALVATFAAASAASADTASGTVQNINTAYPSVTLSDGTTYTYNDRMANGLDPFKVGDSVNIQWITVGSSHEIVSISPAT